MASLARAFDLNNAVLWVPWAWVTLAALLCTAAVLAACRQLYLDVKHALPQEVEGYICRGR